jgi:hypothetical protein
LSFISSSDGFSWQRCLVNCRYTIPFQCFTDIEVWYFTSYILKFQRSGENTYTLTCSVHTHECREISKWRKKNLNSDREGKRKKLKKERKKERENKMVDKTKEGQRK